MKNISTHSILFILAFMLSYCAERVSEEEAVTDGLYFPRQIAQEAPVEQMEALLSGMLTFENKCFRIKEASSGTAYTPIWPAGFDYRLNTDSTFVILNAAGNEVARSGSGIRVSGGEINIEDGLEGQLERGLSGLLLDCPAPYWVVGEEVAVRELQAELSPEVRVRLADWFNFYAPHIADWRLDAFQLNDKWTVDNLPALPNKGIIPVGNRPERSLIYDPTGAVNLDLYARDLMMRSNNDGREIVYALSPDSEVALEYLNRDVRQRLLFCGTPCRFETGFWEDPQTVVIAGLHQGEAEQSHPTIWRIQLKELIVQEYTYPTPLVDPFPYNYVQEVVFAATADQ